jgi:hypothetical protein
VQPYDAATATLTNVTTTGNRTNGTSNGLPYPALRITANTTVSNVTVAFNRIRDGAGVYYDGTLPVIVRNSIFADGCFGAPLPSAGHNIDKGLSCGLNGVGDLVATDPRLSGPKYNGALPKSAALRSGSPAIDAGDPLSCPDADQRGVARPQGAACDIGAYEFDPAQ